MEASIRTNMDSIFVDGSDREVSYSHIMLELDTGARYLLQKTETNHFTYDKARGLVRIEDDVVHAAMTPLVERINTAIKARGMDAINLEYWTEIEPRYGSDRYCNPGIKM